jgi:hypothetical protein
MAEVSVIAAATKTSWQVSEPDGINLVGIFAEVIKGSEPTTTRLSDFDDIDELIELLKDRQNSICAYGTREGDGGTCDCKYTNRMFLSQDFELKGEQTGCCELRAAIQILEKIRG